jgi:hypothetical protein
VSDNRFRIPPQTGADLAVSNPAYEHKPIKGYPTGKEIRLTSLGSAYVANTGGATTLCCHTELVGATVGLASALQSSLAADGGGDTPINIGGGGGGGSGAAGRGHESVYSALHEVLALTDGSTNATLAMRQANARSRKLASLSTAGRQAARSAKYENSRFGQRGRMEE